MNIKFGELDVGSEFKYCGDKLVKTNRFYLMNNVVVNSVHLDGQFKGGVANFAANAEIEVDKHPNTVNFGDLKDGERFTIISDLLEKNTIFQKIRKLSYDGLTTNAIYFHKSKQSGITTLEGLDCSNNAQVIKLKE